MEVDFSQQIIEAKSRSGPKSSAQTPAKPDERKKGSKMNEPGSAGTTPDAKQRAKEALERKDEKEIVKAEITFNDKIINSLKKKVEDHNSKHSKKVSLSQLKKVYRRGLGAFSSSHRPGKSRQQWAMARVNTFLKMMRGEKVKDAYKAADGDIARGSEAFDHNHDFYDFEDIEWQLAHINLIEAGVLEEEMNIFNEDIDYTEAEKKTLNKPFRLPSGSNKKFGVYVKNDKGNTVMVKFGDPNMEIKRDDPERRKNFRARHQCDTNVGPKWKARYWSCRFWSKSPVSKMTAEELDKLDPIEAFYVKQEERQASLEDSGFDENAIPTQEEILALDPLLDNVYYIEEEIDL
jgi:hypothetical protein